MQETDRSGPQRRRSEKKIMLVKAEMMARQLHYGAGYLAARRQRFSAAGEGVRGPADREISR